LKDNKGVILSLSRRKQMAEVDTAVLADQISQASGLINKNVGDNGYRIAAAEANVRDSIGREACGINMNLAAARAENERGFADVRYNVATEAAGLSKQIGAESCAITQSIGDARQEQAENFGHTRRDVQGVAKDLAVQIGEGFCDTDSKVLGTGSDIRREAVEHKADVRQAVYQEGQENVMAVKDARYDLATRITNVGDRIVDRVEETKDTLSDRFFTVGRDLMDLRQGQVTLSKDVELNALKVQLDAKENTKYLSDKIAADGEKTRLLINDLKYHDLSRGLVERNTELVNCEQERRFYKDKWYDGKWDTYQAQFAGQWAQLQSQIQAFQSQLQETRQGMVNFGTMAGVGQSSTSNNVR
jgi:SHS2 domain-containing protein